MSHGFTRVMSITYLAGRGDNLVIFMLAGQELMWYFITIRQSQAGCFPLFLIFVLSYKRTTCLAKIFLLDRSFENSGYFALSSTTPPSMCTEPNGERSLNRVVSGMGLDLSKKAKIMNYSFKGFNEHLLPIQDTTQQTFEADCFMNLCQLILNTRLQCRHPLLFMLCPS